MEKEITKEEFMTMSAISKRAEEEKLLQSNRGTLIMDLEFAYSAFNLRLVDLLNADIIDFTHDIVGIQNNINRTTKKFNEHFVPRFVSINKSDEFER